MNKNLNKVILKHVSITLFVLTVLSFIFVAFFTLLMPKQTAKITYDLGFYKLSEHYHQNYYNKTKDIDDLYNLLLVSIAAKNDESVVKNFEELNSDLGFDELIKEIDLQTENMHLLPKSMAIYLNEKNYLAKRYVAALNNKGKTEVALNFAASNLEVQTNLLEPKMFLFGALIQNNWYEKQEIITFLNSASITLTSENKSMSERMQVSALNEVLSINNKDLNKTVLQKIASVYSANLNLFNTTITSFKDNADLGVNPTIIELSYLVYLHNNVKEIAFVLAEINDKLPEMKIVETADLNKALVEINTKLNLFV